jgi:uncharacterized protein
VPTHSPPSRRAPVPWTPRDVWLSMASVLLVYSVAVVLVRHMPQLRRHTMAVPLSLELLLVVPVAYVACWKYRVGWATVGLRPCPARALRWGGRVLLQFYLCMLIYGLVLLSLHLRIPNPAVSLVKRYAPWFLILYVVVLAPLIEELFFRGFVFAGLRQRYRRPTAALLSATLFALLHLQWTRFVPLAVLGVLLATLYERSNSLWPPIVTHALVNLVALGVAYVRLRTGLPR